MQQGIDGIHRAVKHYGINLGQKRRDQRQQQRNHYQPPVWQNIRDNIAEHRQNAHPTMPVIVRIVHFANIIMVQNYEKKSETPPNFSFDFIKKSPKQAR
jgi:hypothetical protein